MFELKHPESYAILNRMMNDGVQGHIDNLKKLGWVYDHSVNVGLLSIDLGLENSLDEHDIRTLAYSGFLHDIGKQRIPCDIVLNGTPLTMEEREEMARHPEYGYEELCDTMPIEAEIVGVHHDFQKRSSLTEPYDHVAHSRVSELDDDVNRMAQIVAASDFLDALASERPYKHALPVDVIERIMHSQFTGNKRYVEQALKRLPHESP